jgi:hypothetical protein
MTMVIGAVAQGYAVTIEHILCDIYDCERYGFGGVVNSDFIREQPFSAITCALSFVYSNADDIKRVEIDKFIENYYFFRKMSLDLLLSFDSSTKNIDGITYDISFDNGKKAIDTMIEDFRKVIKNN